MSRYSCVTKLGNGQFGVVYKAKDEKIDDFVAIKKIAESNYKSIERELLLLQQCKSKYVITLFNHYTTNGYHCIVLEYCSGGSIENRVGKCSERECKKIAFDVLHGLRYLHGKSIIHRDIKPSNILHSSEGIYKLADFGTCKDMKHSFMLSFTKGTLRYMAPEMIFPNGGNQYDSTVDMWSLGITLYQLITNQFPFNFINAQNAPAAQVIFDDMNKIVQTQPKRLNAENLNGFGGEVCDLINKECLIKDNKRRSSARNLLQHKWFSGDEKQVEQAILISYCESIKSVLKNRYPAAYDVWNAEPEGTISFLKAKGIVQTQQLLKEFDMPFKKGTNNIDAWKEYKDAIYQYLTEINQDDRLEKARDILSNEIWVNHYKRFPLWPKSGGVNQDVIKLNKKEFYIYKNKWFIVWSIGGSIAITDHRPSESIYKARFNGKPTFRVLKVDNNKFTAFNKECTANKAQAIQRVQRYSNVAITWDSL